MPKVNPVQKPLFVALALVTALNLAPATAEAAALACGPGPVFGPGPFSPAPTVFQTLSWWQSPSSCGTPTEFVSIAPPCPAAIGPQLGEYCGPVIMPGTAALCEINPATPLFFGTVLYVGFDFNGDGNILSANGESVFGPIPPLSGTWAVPSPGIPGRVIAYPTNAIGIGPIPIDANFVICV